MQLISKEFSVLIGGSLGMCHCPITWLSSVMATLFPQYFVFSPIQFYASECTDTCIKVWKAFNWTGCSWNKYRIFCHYIGFNEEPTAMSLTTLWSRTASPKCIKRWNLKWRICGPVTEFVILTVLLMQSRRTMTATGGCGTDVQLIIWTASWWTGDKL